MKFTQDAVERFNMPTDKRGRPGADHIEFFEGKPGFGLRIRNSPQGVERRTYIYQYKIGEQHRRITIGDAGKVRLRTAHDAMQIHAGDIAKGKDPARERADQRATEAAAREASLISKAAKTFADHVTDFLEGYRLTHKPRTYVETERLLRKDYWQPLHALRLGDVTRAMVAAQLRAIAKEHGSVPANHARAALSAFYNWAIGEGLCEANPVIGTNKPYTPTARDRVLSDAEVAAIWKAAPDNDYGRIVRLLMLTGQRRDEIGSLHWSEIDTTTKVITLPAERTKNGQPHSVPLTAEALAILAAVPKRDRRDLVFGEGEGGFSGWSAAKKALDKAAKVKEWRLHDLRRTAATRMAESGVLPHVVEAVANHVSGHKAGVAGVYNRASYEPEKRAALETLASYIKTAMAKADGANVHRLKTPKH